MPKKHVQEGSTMPEKQCAREENTMQRKHVQEGSTTLKEAQCKDEAERKEYTISCNQLSRMNVHESTRVQILGCYRFVDH